jgi:peptidoglycan/xylan/chitin deacetylase (PgdA/CDA1 family)
MLDLLFVLLVVALPAALAFAVWRRGRGGARPAGRTWRAVGLCLLATLPLSAAVLRGLVRSRTTQLGGELVSRVETGQKVVALTFDDGPHPEPADEVLGLLQREGVRATFFVTGKALTRHPQLGRRLVEEGHVLANHSFSHARMVFRSRAWMEEELARTDARIREAGHQGPIPFRAPFGKHLLGLSAVLANEGRLHVMWDVAPDEDASAEDITRSVLENARPGSIILLHPWTRERAATRAALPAVLAGLRARGLTPVTLPELLALRGG